MMEENSRPPALVMTVEFDPLRDAGKSKRAGLIRRIRGIQTLKRIT
jgi:hypothetical protein